MKTTGRKCPDCGLRNSKVIDVRHEDDYTYRRRECRECAHRWTTRERDDDDAKPIHAVAQP